jgi:hypothetical protein
MACDTTMVFRSRTLEVLLKRARALVASHPEVPGLHSMLSLDERRAAKVHSPEELCETARWLTDWLDSLELTFVQDKRPRR